MGPDATSARCRPWNSAPGSFSGFLRGEAAPPKPSPVPRTAPVLQTAAKHPAAGRRPRLEVPVPFTHLPLERRGLLGWNRSRFYPVCAHKTQVFRPAAFPFLSFFFAVKVRRGTEAQRAEGPETRSELRTPTATALLALMPRGHPGESLGALPGGICPVGLVPERCAGRNRGACPPLCATPTGAGP